MRGRGDVAVQQRPDSMDQIRQSIGFGEGFSNGIASADGVGGSRLRTIILPSLAAAGRRISFRKIITRQVKKLNCRYRVDRNLSRTNDIISKYFEIKLILMMSFINIRGKATV
jgi:hypothetical protein